MSSIPNLVTLLLVYFLWFLLLAGIVAIVVLAVRKREKRLRVEFRRQVEQQNREKELEKMKIDDL